MPLYTIADSFPAHWSYGQYEQQIHASIAAQIQALWPEQHTLLLSTTWMGPQTQRQIDQLASSQPELDRLVITSTVDSVQNFEIYPLIDALQARFRIKHVSRVGNFDGPHEFNLFAVACGDNFQHYNTEDLILQQAPWLYCCYNRKPYQHRVDMVRTLVQRGLDSLGTVTLGRAFPGEPDHGLYRSIGEQDQDYVKHGHWYDLGTEATPHEIPHDLYSLHNWQRWSGHFLHIVNTTTASNEQDIFANQITFKPLIGLRPFVINGQTRQYQWLRNQGFRTFEHHWPWANLTQGYYGNTGLAQAIADVVQSLAALSESEILALYHSMLPDLIHNRQRWLEYVDQQRHRINHLFQ